MIIDFDKMDFSKKTEFYGGKGNFYLRNHKDAMNNILCSFLEPGASIGYHKHETDSEILYVIKGSGTVLYDNIKQEIREGQCHYCPKGHFHSLTNTGRGELHFFAVVCNQ